MHLLQACRASYYIIIFKILEEAKKCRHERNQWMKRVCVFIGRIHLSPKDQLRKASETKHQEAVVLVSPIN